MRDELEEAKSWGHRALEMLERGDLKTASRWFRYAAAATSAAQVQAADQRLLRRLLRPPSD